MNSKKKYSQCLRRLKQLQETQKEIKANKPRFQWAFHYSNELNRRISHIDIPKNYEYVRGVLGQEKADYLLNAVKTGKAIHNAKCFINTYQQTNFAKKLKK